MYVENCGRNILASDFIYFPYLFLDMLVQNCSFDPRVSVDSLFRSGGDRSMNPIDVWCWCSFQTFIYVRDMLVVISTAEMHRVLVSSYLLSVTSNTVICFLPNPNV